MFAHVAITLYCYKGCEPLCACAEGGVLLFGDGNGNIAMTDRDFNVSWVHKAFSGPVRGVAYVYDLLNHRRQYVIAAGEETPRLSGGESKSRSQDAYVIKVHALFYTYMYEAFLLHYV